MAIDPQQIAQRARTRLNSRRINIAPGGLFAYRPGELVVSAPSGVEPPEIPSRDPEHPNVPGDPIDYETQGRSHFFYKEVPDTLRTIRELREDDGLRDQGITVSPNHVYFGEAGYPGGPTYGGAGVYAGNPAYGGLGVYAGNPAYGGLGVYAGNPAYGGLGVYAGNPAYWGIGVYAGNPFDTNNARPFALPPEWLEPSKCDTEAHVLILDTGLRTVEQGGNRAPAHPRLRDRASVHDDWRTQENYANLDQSRWDEDLPDTNADELLDRQAGHGTFIAGIIARWAPDADIHTQGVLSSFGDGDDEDIALGLQQGLTQDDKVDIVNMSFGAYTEDNKEPPVLADAIRDAVAQGTVVVAAAGNNGSCRPFWPAAMEDVIAVGANFCGERAAFSNFGPWVDANAPGVDIVSTFLDFDGPACEIAGSDPDLYEGWAEWSGTSFAAPRVAAEIAKVMCESGVSAKAATEKVVPEDDEEKGEIGVIDELGVVVALDDWMD